MKGGQTLFPSEASDFFYGDAETISFREYTEIKAGEQYIDVEAWNEDTIYEHVVGVRMGVLEVEGVSPIGAADTLVRKLFKFFGVKET